MGSAANPPARPGSRPLRAVQRDQHRNRRVEQGPRLGRAADALVTRDDLPAGAHPHLLALLAHHRERVVDPGLFDPRPQISHSLSRAPCQPSGEVSCSSTARYGGGGGMTYQSTCTSFGTRSGNRLRSSIATNPECEAAHGTKVSAPAASATASASATISSSPKSAGGGSDSPWPRHSLLRTRRRPEQISATCAQRSLIEHQPVRKRSAGSPVPRSS